MARLPPPKTPAEIEQDFKDFCSQCAVAIKEIFDAAKAKAEVQFALALAPEMRGMQDAGWNTAWESREALIDYDELIRSLPPNKLRVRVGLSLYSHLSEASGLYEVPKNMLRIGEGRDYNLWPFQDLVRTHKLTGERIAPGASKIMQDLLGHAKELGFENFCEVLTAAFDPEIRNGYAHADYVVWTDGIRLPHRNGGRPRLVTYDEFEIKMNRAMGFFQVLTEEISNAMGSYRTPVYTMGRLNNREPMAHSKIHLDEENRFSVSVGISPPKPVDPDA